VGQWFDFVEMEFRSGFSNQERGNVLNPIKIGADKGRIAEEVNHPWNPVRMQMNRFYAVGFAGTWNGCFREKGTKKSGVTCMAGFAPRVGGGLYGRFCRCSPSPPR